MPTFFREKGESDTSLSMLDGMRRGDSAAWERFVTIFGGLLYDRLRRKGFAPPDAEDLVQEVFIKVQTSFSTFVRDGSEKLFRKWLNSVVRSATVDYVRRRRDAAPVGGDDAHAALQQIPDGIGQLVENDEDHVLLLIRTMDAVKHDFTDQVWKGFWKTQVEGLTSTEAAEQLSTTAGAVRTGADRVKRRLKDELRGMID